MNTGRVDNQWIGVGLYFICVLAMASNGIIVKLVGEAVPLTQILLFRFGFSLLPLLLVGLRQPSAISLRTRRPLDHGIRALVGVCSIGLYFLAVQRIPLAGATALSYAAPLFCVALAVPILGETIGVRRITAVTLGFGGVVLIALVDGGLHADQFLSVGTLAGIGSGFCGGLVLVYLRKLSDTESPMTSSLIYNGFGTLLFATVLLLNGWQPMSVSWWSWLILLGLIAGVQQFVLASAYRYAEASLLAPMEYLVLVFAALAGFVVWGEVPGLMTWLGAALIAGAGLFAFSRERSQR